MSMSRWTVLAIVMVAFSGGFAARGAFTPEVTVHAAADRVFEMRTYTANPGKFEALKARFRDHTLKLFAKHGITNVGYWIPIDAPLSENTLVYILAYPSRDAAKASWAAFQGDPDWVKARTESEKDGRILVKSPESVFLNPADFSPMK
jgi:hypothetical protein